MATLIEELIVERDTLRYRVKELTHFVNKMQQSRRYGLLTKKEHLFFEFFGYFIDEEEEVPFEVSKEFRDFCQRRAEELKAAADALNERINSFQEMR